MGRAGQMGTVGRVVRHVALISGAVVMLAPFAWMVLTSFKTQGDIFSPTLTILPQRWAAVDNYAAALTRVPLAHFLLNGVVVTASIFLFQLLVNLPAAYALAKLRFRGRTVIVGLVLACLMIPYHTIAIPIYLMLYKVGLLDTYAALILPFIISVFGIFLMRQFFMTVPDDLIDAARIDGIGEFAIVWRVMMPTALPAVTAFGIFSVVAHWNDYFWPLIAVGTQALYTPPLGIVFFRLNDQGTEYGPLMAAATIVIAPLVLAFLVAQRRFIEGITFTGMKT